MFRTQTLWKISQGSIPSKALKRVLRYGYTAAHLCLTLHSPGTLHNHSRACQEEDALLFFFVTEDQAILRLMRPSNPCCSLTVLEGIALASDRNYKVLGAAYPWIAKKVLTDRSPALRATLKELLYQVRHEFFQRGASGTSPLNRFGSRFLY